MNHFLYVRKDVIAEALRNFMKAEQIRGQTVSASTVHYSFHVS